MSEKIYGKSELEQPKFSTIEVQELLNYERTLKIELAQWKALALEMNNILIAIRTQAKANGYKNIENICQRMNTKVRLMGLE